MTKKHGTFNLASQMHIVNNELTYRKKPHSYQVKNQSEA